MTTPVAASTTAGSRESRLVVASELSNLTRLSPPAPSCQLRKQVRPCAIELQTQNLPDAFRALRGTYLVKYGQRVAALGQAVRTLSALAANVTPHAVVHGRIKGLLSAYRKLCSGRETRDYLGVRIIVPDVGDCYETIRSIHAACKVVMGQDSDYVERPKRNGYQSLHTTIIGPGAEPIEIQVRTRRMHVVCERGSAAHDRYKKRGGDAESLVLPAPLGR